MPEKKPLIIKPKARFSLNFALGLGNFSNAGNLGGTAGSVNVGQLRRDVSGNSDYRPRI